MKTMQEIIRAHAGVLDSQHRPTQAIRVQGTRATLRKYFPNEKHGAPLKVGGHELIIVPRFQAAPLDQSDLEIPMQAEPVTP